MRKKITLIALISIAVFFATYVFLNRDIIKNLLWAYFKPTTIEEIREPLGSSGLGVCNLDG